MKLLWLCNIAPGAVQSHIRATEMGAVNWVDHVLSDIRRQGITLRILCRGSACEGVLDEHCSYRCFGEFAPHIYHQQLEEQFREELRSFRPDVIHSWGVEYSHALAMVNAAEKEGLLSRMAASIQGLCAILSEHYTDGIPEQVCRSSTFRDWVRKDNLLQQQEKFSLRGELEETAVRKLHHVIGRTSWDKKAVKQWNPEVRYHFCNETLREPFYSGAWHYADCTKHRIFASSCSYPIKGFHFLLEAFREVLKTWPDATLAVTGKSVYPRNWKEKLRQGSYEKYLRNLAGRYGVEDRLVFLGNLSAEKMKEAYLASHVFVLPSVMENSPNSLGEAMLLGVPCVAADVGGVRDMMKDRTEGFVCRPADPSELARCIQEVFSLREQAETIGTRASAHAALTHDPQDNLQQLLQIYREVAQP